MKFIKMKWCEVLDNLKVLDCIFEKKLFDSIVFFNEEKLLWSVIVMYDVIMWLILINEKICF